MNTIRLPGLEKCANVLAAVLVVITPFHTFLTIWAAGVFGHYTAIRLWSELLLLILLGIVGYWLATEVTLRKWLFNNLLVRLILLYVLLTLTLGLVALLKGDVTPKALGYGLVVNLRYLLFFVAVLAVVYKSRWLEARWMRLLLVPAVVVSVFALLQYTVLPHNFLAHFGYGLATVAPIETINHNANYIRVQSTLRGANPLGAYMVVVFGVLASMWQLRRRRMWVAGIALLAAEALLFSFSRSAWIGAGLAVVVAFWLQLQTQRARLVTAAVLAGIVLLSGGAFLALRHEAALQNAVFHTDNSSTIAVTSNEAHVSATKEALKDVVDVPFGGGPGTAGPASVYNGNGRTRIAENYFIQVGQEVGWAGMILLVAIFGLLAAELYQLRKVSILALGLFASFVGLAFVALLSHVWTDVTLAYVWWGFAAIAYGAQLERPETKAKKHGKPAK